VSARRAAFTGEARVTETVTAVRALTAAAASVRACDWRWRVHRPTATVAAAVKEFVAPAQGGARACSASPRPLCWGAAG